MRPFCHELLCYDDFEEIILSSFTPMILAILVGVSDVFSDRSARPARMFSDFSHGELNCVQSVDSRTLMLCQVGLRVHFAKWSIEGEGTEQQRLTPGIINCIIGLPTFYVAHSNSPPKWHK